MSAEQARIIESQQKQIRTLTKELNAARQTISETYSVIPKLTGPNQAIASARRKLSYYLKERGLI